MINYELHTLKKHGATREWTLDAVFEDRELAVHEATIMDNGDRYAGIRVIAEDHNPGTGKTETTTIFRGGSNFKEAKARVAEGTAGAGKRLPPEPREFVRKPRAAVTTETPVPMLLLFLLIGIGGMYALYELVPD